MRKGALALAILAALTLCACRFGASDRMFAYTGEEELLPQVRGMAQLATSFLHPQPRTAPQAPAAHAAVNPFGINTFLEQEVEEWKRERAVQMIADAGFHWIRQEFPWEDIEIHGKGDFVDRRNDPAGIDAWAKYDHIVGLADRYGLEVIARLSNPPAWTRALTDTVGSRGPPDDLTDWGDYVYAVVSRYRGQVRCYELWNEPNIYPEWGEQPVDAEEYTRLLCEGYRRAKEADPGVVVISGALAPTVSFHPGPGPSLGLSDFVFLQRMYDAGAGDCFDVLAVNDYMLWSGPTDHRMRPLNVNFSRPVYVRDIMVANGDAAKPIWISEMNSNAVPDDPAILDRGVYGQVTLEQQARYAVLAYERTMEEWPWVGVVNFWFFKRATDRERNQAMYYFRMVEPDFTPMPVYEAMREYTAGLTPTLYPGVHQENHWAIDYEGDWRTVDDQAAVLGGYRRAASAGARLRFTFEGGALTLQPGPGEGAVEVRVDGGTVRSVSLSGGPVPLVWGPVLGASKGWLRERHEVMLTAARGEVSVDEIIVYHPWRPRFWEVLGAAGVSFATTWTLVRGLRER